MSRSRRTGPEIQAALDELDQVVAEHIPAGQVESYGVASELLPDESELAAKIALRKSLEKSEVEALGRELPADVRGFDLVLCQEESALDCAGAKGGDGVLVPGAQTSGTVGCLVWADGEPYALTCEHVLGVDPEKGMSVQWRQQGRSKPEGQLGTVVHLCGLNFSGDHNESDSALIKTDGPLKHRGRKPTGATANPYDALIQKFAVAKMGWKTGLTTGRVTGILNVRVRCTHEAGAETVVRTRFHPRVLEITDDTGRAGFCDVGDSGSVIWATEKRRGMDAVGLLFSTVYGYKGYAIPMDRVLNCHKVRLVK
jgi:hypothetical protein